MANDKQFKLKTLYIGTRGVKEYRASIAKHVTKRDRILEIGCEWGTTSKFLHKNCENLLATDISSKVLEKARTIHPEIEFRKLDVFNIRSAIDLGYDFNKMYIDVSGLSGYRSLLDVIALLEMYSAVFDLETIVIKSGALKNFAKRCQAFSPPQG
jgi:2-polyprenyl-3-methyl-5-hydroxy-6-metoxy-1,4-benzoquinol methylase